MWLLREFTWFVTSPAVRVRSTVMSMSVCLSVCLSASMSQRRHVQTSWNFLSVLTAALARPPLSTVQYCNAISYVLPVLWIMSCLTIQRVANGAYAESDSPGGRTGGEVWCLQLPCLVNVVSVPGARRKWDQTNRVIGSETACPLLHLSYIYTTINFTDEFMNVSVALRWRKWAPYLRLAGRGLCVGDTRSLWCQVGVPGWAWSLHGKHTWIGNCK